MQNILEELYIAKSLFKCIIVYVTD